MSGIICEPRSDCADPNVNRWYCMRGHADKYRGIKAQPGVCPLAVCERRGANHGTAEPSGGVDDARPWPVLRDVPRLPATRELLLDEPSGGAE